MRVHLALLTATGALAGCLGTDADAPSLPEASPAREVEVTPDSVRIYAPGFRGPFTLAVRVEAEHEAVCMSAVFGAPLTHAKHGYYGLVHDSREATRLFDAKGLGAGSSEQAVELRQHEPQMVVMSLSGQAFVGTRWIWLHAPDIGGEEATRSDGSTFTSSGVFIDIKCPGARLAAFAGDRFTPLTWQSRSDAAAETLFDYDAWVAAIPAVFDARADHVLVAMVPGFFGSDARMALEGPAGVQLLHVTEDPVVFHGSAGKYSVRVVSREDMPGGVIAEAGVVDLASWVAERSTAAGT